MKVLFCLAMSILFIFGVTAMFFVIFADFILYLMVGKKFYLGERFGEWYEGVFD